MGKKASKRPNGRQASVRKDPRLSDRQKDAVLAAFLLCPSAVSGVLANVLPYPLSWYAMAFLCLATCFLSARLFWHAGTGILFFGWLAACGSVFAWRDIPRTFAGVVTVDPDNWRALAASLDERVLRVRGFAIDAETTTSDSYEYQERNLRRFLMDASDPNLVREKSTVTRRVDFQVAYLKQSASWTSEGARDKGELGQRPTIFAGCECNDTWSFNDEFYLVPIKDAASIRDRFTGKVLPDDPVDAGRFYIGEPVTSIWLTRLWTVILMFGPQLLLWLWSRTLV